MSTPKPKVLTLKQRIQAIAAQSAPSMIPVPREEQPAPPPEKEVEVLPEASAFIDDPKKKIELARLVARHGELGELKKPISKEQKSLTAKIKIIVGKAGIGKAISGEWRINYYNAPRHTINAKKLLAAGVPQSTIDECTDVSASYTLRITKEGTEDDAGEE